MEKEGNQRSIKMLDFMLNKLKFFTKYNEIDRKNLLKTAKYAHMKTREIIFKQGDKADYMYVILKGRVCVEIKNKGFEETPIVIATLGDGDHFGELGMVDYKKLSKKVNKYTEFDALGKEVK